MELLGDLLGLAVLGAGRELDVKQSCSNVLFSVSGPSKVVPLPSSHCTSRPLSPLTSLRMCADVFRDIERHRLVLEVLDLVLDDNLLIEQVSGDSLVVIPVDGALDDDVLGDAEVELHLVVDRRELAPVFAEERGGLVLILCPSDENADLAVGQRRRAELSALSFFRT